MTSSLRLAGIVFLLETSLSMITFFCVVVGIEPRASHTPNKCSAEQHPELFLVFLILRQGLAKLPRLALNLLCSTHRFELVILLS